MPAVDYVKVKIVIEVPRVRVLDDNFGSAIDEVTSGVKITVAGGRIVSASAER